MALPSAVVPILDATIVHEKRSHATDKAAVLSPPDKGGVRVVAPHEYKKAAACLAEAFRTDDIVRYPIDTPDRMHLSEEERFEMHKCSLEYVTYAHCLQGLVLTVGDNFDCVALWLPPGKNIDDWMTILRSGMWRLSWKLSKEGRIRFFEEFLPLLGSSKAEVLGERDHNSWYLNYVGTKPEGRGRGYARKLIEHVTRMVWMVQLDDLLTQTNLLRLMLLESLATSRARTMSTSPSTAKWGSNFESKSISGGRLGRN